MKIEKYLKKKKISILEFSKIVRVPVSSLYHYINGKRTPHIATALHIEKVTKKEITVRDLIND